jgi:hypothetical protein
VRDLARRLAATGTSADEAIATPAAAFSWQNALRARRRFMLWTISFGVRR